MVSSKDILNNDDHAALGLTVYAVFNELTGKEGDRTEVGKEHFAYLAKLEAEGKIFAAGPLLLDDGGKDGRSLITLKADSLEEARALAEADPYYKSGFRTFTMRTWKINEGGFDLKVRFAAGSYDLE